MPKTEKGEKEETEKKPPGGEWTPERKAAHAKKMRELALGRKHSEETKKKIGKSSRGRHHTDETKELQSEITKRRNKESE